MSDSLILGGGGHTCTGCGHTFSSLARFDDHRTGSFERDERTCLHPRDAGLVHHRTRTDRHGRPIWTRPWRPATDPRTADDD